MNTGAVAHFSHFLAHSSLDTSAMCLRTYGAVLAAVLFSAGYTSGADIYWTASTSNGKWSQSTNWSPDTVPGADDNAFVIRPDQGPSLTISHDSDIVVSNLHLGGSKTTLAGDHNITVRGQLLWNGGTLRGGGVLDVLGTMILSIPRFGSNRVYGKTINNHTAAFVVDPTGGTSPGPFWFGSKAVFQNLPGAFLQVTNESNFYAESGPPGDASSLTNWGTIRKAGAAMPSWFILRFCNFGQLEIAASYLLMRAGTSTNADYDMNQFAGKTILNGGSLWLTASSTDGTFDNFGGLLGGFGTVTGNVRNFKHLSPGVGPGRLGLTGTYYQFPSASLNIEIGGTNAGINFDQLQVKRAASLSGVVNVSLSSGFLPAPGDRFEVLTCSRLTNTLTGFNGLQVGKDLRLEPIITSTNITLVAMTTPPLSAPRFVIFAEGDELVFAWPRGFEDLSLQHTPALPPSWRDIVPLEPNRIFLDPGDAPSCFLRLAERSQAVPGEKR
jgi:hypothetical protein